MKVINNTHWATKDLKRIAARVVREELPRDRFGSRAKSYTVVISYNRQRGGNGSCSGFAYYHSNSCRVNVPSDFVNPVDFAYLVGHEVGHSKGLHHGRMAPHHTRSMYTTNHYAWAISLTITKQPIKVTVRPTIDKKLAHAEQMAAQAATRAKRATTILKKWQRKVRYYQAATVKQMGKAAAHAVNKESDQ